MKLKFIIILSLIANSFLFSQYNGGSGYGFTSGSTTAVQVVAFLQGPYSGGTMTITLNTNNFIPLTQPYNTAPWNYTGTESVLSIPSGVVDWVLIELRTNTADSTTVQKRACFILNNGSIVDTDGTSPVKLNKTGGTPYYIVVRHRNHLAVMSTNSLSLSSSLSGSYLTGANPEYNFSTAQTQAFGTNPMSNLSGAFGLITGDGNRDGLITSTDFNVFNPRFTSGANGYEISDWNLDGSVTSTDFNFFNPNFITGKQSYVP